MIAPLEVVTGMELTPQSCVLCANNPVDDVTGEQQPAIFAPGVDVNWGDSVYICASCVNIMADLFGRVDEEKHELVVGERDALEARYERTKTELDRAKALLERVADGRKAEKEIKKREKVS